MKLSNFGTTGSANLLRLSCLFASVKKIEPPHGYCAIPREYLRIPLCPVIREIADYARNEGVEDFDLHLVDVYYAENYAEICTNTGDNEWDRIIVSLLEDRDIGRRLTSDRIIKMLAHMKRYMVAALPEGERIEWEDLL
jgi:hypothetical protein